MRANIPDLKQWLAKFQPELQDDIDHGARIDCTRKPGFYVRQYLEFTPDPHGDLVIHDYDGWETSSFNEFKQRLIDADNITVISNLVYRASRDEHGFEIVCNAHLGECVYDCFKPEFDSLEQLEQLDCKALYELFDSVSITWNGKQEAADYIASHTAYGAYRAEPVWVTDDRAVFLTRKSGERYQKRHPRPDSRIYAGFVWHNPDLYNTIALLAALDLEKSTLVFDENRLDQLDY
ncbi:MAG: hypothetical protein E7I43_07190 [Actinomyces sp.]|nr:hypothetical protein [Actinomyces sp.]